MVPLACHRLPRTCPDFLGVLTRLDDLAQPHVQALDGVSRVDHPGDVRGEDEERRDVLTGPLPGSDDHRALGQVGPSVRRAAVQRAPWLSR